MTFTKQTGAESMGESTPCEEVAAVWASAAGAGTQPTRKVAATAGAGVAASTREVAATAGAAGGTEPLGACPTGRRNTVKLVKNNFASSRM